VTETALIYLLTALTLARLLCHVRPSLLDRLDRIAKAKLLEGVDSVVWAGVVALLLIHFVVRSFYIPSGSMLPTLHINDFILVNEMIYEFSDPVRGDIVVFHPPYDPNAPAQSIDKTDLIKRVVGLPYDTIEVKDGVLYLNNQALDEPFIKEPILKNYGPTRVDAGEIFVMGDNRNDSKDSRYIGSIPMENLVGRAEIIFYPFNRIRVFNFPR
jgi:signal peptidase I